MSFKLKLAEIRSLLKLANIEELISEKGYRFDVRESEYIKRGFNQVFQATSHNDYPFHVLIVNGKLHAGHNYNCFPRDNFVPKPTKDISEIAPPVISESLLHTMGFLNLDILLDKDDELKAMIEEYNVSEIKEFYENSKKRIDELNASGDFEGRQRELSRASFLHYLAQFYYLKLNNKSVELPVLFDLVDNVYSDAYESFQWTFAEIYQKVPYLGFCPRLSKKLLTLGDALAPEDCSRLLSAARFEENQQTFNQELVLFLSKRSFDWYQELFNDTSVTLSLVLAGFHGSLKQIVNKHHALRETYIDALILSNNPKMMRYLVDFNNNLTIDQKNLIKTNLSNLYHYEMQDNQDGLVYYGLCVMVEKNVSLSKLNHQAWQRVLASAGQARDLKVWARMLVPKLLPLEGNALLTTQELPFLVKAIIDDEDDALLPHIKQLVWHQFKEYVSHCSKVNLLMHTQHLFSSIANLNPDESRVRLVVDKYKKDFNKNASPSAIDALVFLMACYLNPVQPYSVIFEGVSLPDTNRWMYPNACILNDAQDAMISLADIYDEVVSELSKCTKPDKIKLKYRALDAYGFDETRDLTVNELRRVYQAIPEISPQSLSAKLALQLGKTPKNMAEAIDALVAGLRAGGKTRGAGGYDAGADAMLAIQYFAMVYDSLSEIHKTTLNGLGDFDDYYNRTIRKQGYQDTKAADMINAQSMSTSFCVEVLSYRWSVFKSDYNSILSGIPISVDASSVLKSYVYCCVLNEMKKPQYNQIGYHQNAQIPLTLFDYRDLMPQKYQDDCRAFQKPFGSNVPYMEVLHSDVRTVPEQAFENIATKHTRTYGGVLFKPPVSKSAYNDYVQKSVQP